MSDNISRKAAIDESVGFIIEYCGAAFDEKMQIELKQRLEKLPSTDSTRVICGFEGCKYWTKGVCTKNEIILDEAVDGIFVGCPDAEWDYTKGGEEE